MNLYARYGDKVVFHGQGADPKQNSNAKQFLRVGGVYTVKNVDRYSSYSTVQLVEGPYLSYRTDMFRDYEDSSTDSFVGAAAGAFIGSSTPTIDLVEAVVDVVSSISDIFTDD